MNKEKFNLEKFLSNHKPINLKDIIKYYLLDDKLNGYTLLTKDDMNLLQPQKYYVRYVLSSDVIINEKNVSHKIHAGGFFVSAGYLEKGTFVTITDHKKFTHLMLCYKIIQDDKIVKVNTYTINIDKYYIFIKPMVFMTRNEILRTALKKISKNI